MMGTSNDELRRCFGFLPMPATLQQLQDANPKVDRIYQIINTMVSNGGAVQEGDKFWISDEVMTEGIVEAEKNVVFWQKRIEYLKTQQQAFATRKPDQI